MKTTTIALWLGLAAAPWVWAELPPVACDGETVCREEGTNLPLMVLPRAFTHLYQEADLSRVVQENIPAFMPLFVFSREVQSVLGAGGRPEGRYQVAMSEQGPPVGWLKAEDVLEWRQALTAAFTHPGSGEEARQRVLMFRRAEDIDALIASEELELQALQLYRRIGAGEVPPQVLSKEPEAFTDINKTFYLLPIVGARLRDLYGDELRLVRVASALPGERADREAPDLLTNRRFYQDQSKTAPAPEVVKAIQVDVVFVMDMTLSMQPYIDRTREALEGIVRSMTRDGLQERFRFGLVGYRDAIEQVPALEFVARNFTPRLLDVADFIGVLEQEARAATVSSPGYSEDLFAGVEQGLDSAWRANSLRIMILVGDASGHPPGHAQNSTGKDADVLAMAAQDLQVHILSLQLLNPKHPEDQPLAAAQFGRLARVRGAEAREPSRIQVRTDQEEDFQQAVEGVSRLSTRFVGLTREQGAKSLDDLDDLDAGVEQEDSVPGRAVKAMKRVIRSAMVEYLGQAAKPPRDLLAWAADRDLTNPSFRALEVRVLLSKEQLSDLILALDRILQALQQAKMSNLDFFDALQGLAAQSMKRPDEIARVDSVRQAGLVPKFIESLPYRSEILALDRERYASLTAEQRSDLIRRLGAKLSQYVRINESVDGWQSLSGQDGAGRKLYPLQLDYLP
jgi:serine/threonine-protein kinase PpkA